MLDFGKIAARTAGGHPFIAELGGRPIAAGGFAIYNDVCVFAGATTIPDFRRKGAQNELLAARSAFAVRNGCKLALMRAPPRQPVAKERTEEWFPHRLHPNKMVAFRLSWAILSAFFAYETMP